MMMCKRQTSRMSLIALVMPALLAGVSVRCQACGVPVFRYALERWPADAYQVVIFHEGPLAPPTQALVDRLKAFEEIGYGRPPLIVHTQDVTGEMDEALAPAWQVCREDPLPLLALLPPVWQESTQVLWSAPLSEESVETLLQSPVRQELIERLTSGQTAVWLFLPSGDSEKDAPVRELLQQKLPEIEASLKLPHEIDPEDTTYDIPMQSDVALRIEFSVLPLDLKDPQESVLAALLGGSMSEDLDSFLPALIPVFGRGRALTFLGRDTIVSEAIEEICFFVSGPCSCQIKQMNPGMDLFIPVDWDGLITGLIGPDEIVPSLIVPALSESMEETEPNRGTMGQVSSPTAGLGLLKRNLIGVAIAGLLIVVVGTSLFLRRSAR